LNAGRDLDNTPFEEGAEPQVLAGGDPLFGIKVVQDQIGVMDALYRFWIAT
jgi:hypothetical protein